jgi:hypothetical protein
MTRDVPPEAARAAVRAGLAQSAGRAEPMALIGFKPTKARLVLADGSETLLVMKVAVSPGESIALTSGGTLEALGGSLRIRERRLNPSRSRAKTVGTLLFVPGSAKGGADAAAKFQIDVSLESRKFAALLDVALAGGLPSKFFVEAGERLAPGRTRGIGYALVNGVRTKVWDNRRQRILPVAGFTMILPVAVPPAPAVPQLEDEAPALGSLATNAQLAELADELLVFQGETRHTLMAIGGIVGVVIVLLVVATVVLMLR